MELQERDGGGTGEHKDTSTSLHFQTVRPAFLHDAYSAS